MVFFLTIIFKKNLYINQHNKKKINFKKKLILSYPLFINFYKKKKN